MMKADSLVLPAGAVLGLVTGIASVREQPLVTLLIAAAVGFGLGWRPLLLIGVIVIFDENYVASPYFQDSPPILTAGWQVYEQRTAGLSPALALLMVAGVGILIRLALRKRADHSARQRAGDTAIAVLVGLCALSATMSLLQEDSAISARTLIQMSINAFTAALPWITVLLAYLVCVHELRQPDFARRLGKLAVGALLVKAVIGLGVLLTHGGATVDAQSHVIFYDAALPALAASGLLGYLLAPSSRQARVWCVLASSSIVLFSFRRAIWLALVGGFLLLPIARKRTYIGARVLGVIALGTVVVALLPAGVRSTAFGRVGSAISVVSSGRGEASAQAHADDVKVGLEAAKDNPFGGVGVRAPQLKKLAAEGASALYVHNDFLQTWLRFGLAGVLGLVLLLAVAGQRAWQLLSSEPLDALQASAAAFCLIIALPLMTAPFITTTRRWPILLGIAMAIVRSALVRRNASQVVAAPAETVRRLVAAGAGQ